MKAERAAAYLDMSRSKFLELVERGIMPKPKVIDGMVMWDRLSLDAVFSDLPERGETDTRRPNSFDEVLKGH
jgi:predicted DNA-binding transcriptional regulator AlpA